MSNFVNLLDVVYPVGSIYISTNSTSPSSIVGGTWTRVSQGTYLCAAGTTEAALSTHGANTHTLTINEMPRHEHGTDSCWKWEVSYKWNTGGYSISSNANGNTSYSSDYYTGGGAAHNNRPLSMSVWIWYRTA